MKITLNQDPSFSETEVIINCPQPDEDILRLVAMLRIHQKKLVGILDGERRLLDVKDIRPELGGRLLVTMDNGEQVYVSRQYAGDMKEKLRELERSILR